MPKVKFDAEKLYYVVDRERRRRHWRWKQVAAEADVDASTFSRMAMMGGSPSVENLAKILLWLGDTDMRRYIKVDTDIKVMVAGG